MFRCTWKTANMGLKCCGFFFPTEAVESRYCWISFQQENITNFFLADVRRQHKKRRSYNSALTLNIKYVGYAKLCLQGRMAHHTGKRLPLGVALRLPHVAHMCGAGAVGLILTLFLTSSIELCLPKDLRGRTTPLGYAGGHQWLIAAIQQSCGASRHIDLWLHCVKERRGRGGNDRIGKRLQNEYRFFCVCIWINNVHHIVNGQREVALVYLTASESRLKSSISHICIKNWWTTLFNHMEAFQWRHSSLYCCVSNIWKGNLLILLHGSSKAYQCLKYGFDVGGQNPK